MKNIFCILILLCITTQVISQRDLNTAPARDTTETVVSSKKSSIGTIFSGQPGKAMLYSFVLPGAGQLYNKRWWKVPLALAVEGAGVYNLMQNLDQFNRFDNCYKSILDNDLDPVTCGTITDEGRAFTVRQTARSNKELAWIFMGGAHLLVAVEAFIDRHLINFDTSDKLSFSTPSFQSPGVVPLFGVQLNLNKKESNSLDIEP